MCQVRDGVEDSNAEIRFFNNNVKQMNNKNHPEGEIQAGRRLAHSQTWNSHDVRQRISTGLQTQGDYIGRQTRVTRETQLEPLKQWLSNKMGGDRQSTWEHMAPTNNKPCAQHTETSGGQPGHTSRTMTRWWPHFGAAHGFCRWLCTLWLLVYFSPLCFCCLKILCEDKSRGYNIMHCKTS